MSYTKQNFKDGNVLTASQLDHIEEGIVALEEKIENNSSSGGGTSTNAVLYTEQTLDQPQRAQARKNILAAPDSIGNYASGVVYNYPDKTTVQMTNFLTYGKVCSFCFQFTVNETITDGYGFNFITLPKASIGRIWINNETKFYIDSAGKDIKVNGSSIAKGNYIWTGVYFSHE